MGLWKLRPELSYNSLDLIGLTGQYSIVFVFHGTTTDFGLLDNN